MRYSSVLAFFAALTLLAACTTQKSNDQSQEVYGALPPKFVTLLKAQGGLEKWQSSGSLEFVLFNPKDSTRERHLIDLTTRKDLIEADSFKIGFDGDQVWVSPNKKAYKGKSARFYHNLFSYFFAIPYFLADKGVNYSEDTVQIDGQKYDAIKCTFSTGMGDADKDIYKMLVDPSSKKLYGLLYTVTYYSGEAHENYNFLKYEDWQEAGGLQFPGKLISYKYANDSLVQKRFEFVFENPKLSNEGANDAMFAIPAQSEIDSLIKRK